MSGEVISLLLSFQPDSPEFKSKREYDIQARRFAHDIANLSPQHFARGADTSQDILEICNPAVNTIAYIFPLQYRIAAAGGTFQSPKHVSDQLKPGGALWNKAVNFLENADPIQLRYVGAEWRKLCTYIEQVARFTGTPALAISPIRSGMLRLDPTSGTFTSVHLQFIRICVETRSYAAANPILDNYIHSLPGSIPQVVRESLEFSVPASDKLTNSGEFIHAKSGHSDKISLPDLQEYYLLGSHAYIGQRQWAKAMRLLEHILVTPVVTGVGNGLMLEAYKKWVLVTCLVHGTAKPLPRTTNTSAFKGIKAASKAYDALADAFADLSNLPKLRAQINAGRDTWAEDGNLGLVNQLAENQYRFYVARLSRTFSAIPVSKIAAALDGTVQNLTTYLEGLIANGDLNASLEQTNRPELGVVLRFYPDPTKGPLAKTEKQQLQALLAQTERTNLLAEQVKSADYRLSLTKEYIEHIKRVNKKATQGGGGGDAMDMQFEEPLEEDLMQ
ncbi:hypothetical protein BU24DRAFT_412563 [Aaosphaeria arxii CBS 175.79]|uniref:COP9 signalosome complex subunit 3 n=1 Tax=Aaosphaeria arxii CBS 175.79 TaxID=1450172 RepID=A0A6A5XFU6_9PLEO|nr:uncharacterized protein BU24DRAFT_412563 [Aaosphaeria arxii CBS 175.79]KAF2012028.1 hypothetical protein BU24DRAFT_412563 [Aaosphaeria arxii CBS 175.79]